MTKSAQPAQFAPPGPGLAFGERVLVADGAMGTMLQASDISLDERATFLGQWGLKPACGGGGPSYAELAETEGRPRLRMSLDRIQTEGLLTAGVVYGYYRRCSFGYPACPDLADRAKVVQLLAPERIGVSLTEEFQLVPEQSTDALIAFHPEARYFSA